VLPWGEFSVSADALSLIFLGLVFVIPALSSVYGLGYWKQTEHAKNGQRLGLFFGMLVGSMALVVIARDAVLFLMAWEVMALSAYFAATADEENPEVYRTGWIYLVATHLGTLCLIAMFTLWRQASGSFALELTHSLPAQTAGALFILTVVGFGFKAGLMPLHVWLPGAHANAPSHVSAVMSGVMLKMGLYGILRMTALLPQVPAWWGHTLLIAGAITALAGIVFALGQTDIKRFLAYSSIENVGIMALGVGLALLGRSQGRWDWVILGLGGALLHIWNHGLFKSLLFLCAGSVIHTAHTRDINQLGGLARRMPRVAFLFVMGAAAICALPPLNGFVGEWLLYLGFFHTLSWGGAATPTLTAATVVVLAMVGSLAVAGFVMLFGAIFLGARRTSATEHAHDPALSMLVPMWVLAAGCLVIGFFPLTCAPWLERAVAAWAPGAGAAVSLTALAPLNWFPCVGFGLLLLAGVISLGLKLSSQAKTVSTQGTWDCGYARPSGRMQYTGSSFEEPLERQFAFMLWPRKHWHTLSAIFPKSARFRTLLPDAVLDRLVLPFFHAARNFLPRINVFQQGQTHFYVLYILVITIILLSLKL
jgi:hydrogenase-4 component B